MLALMCHSMCYRQLQWVVCSKNSTTIFKCMCAFRQRALHTWRSRPQFSPPFVKWDLSFWPTPSHGSGMNVTTIQEILDWGSRGRFLSHQQTCDGRKYDVVWHHQQVPELFQHTLFCRTNLTWLGFNQKLSPLTSPLVYLSKVEFNFNLLLSSQTRHSTNTKLWKCSKCNNGQGNLELRL